MDTGISIPYVWHILLLQLLLYGQPVLLPSSMRGRKLPEEAGLHGRQSRLGGSKRPTPPWQFCPAGREKVTK